MTNETITLRASNGREHVDVVPRWRGRALAVHPPLKVESDRPAFVEKHRGLWSISAPSCGLLAGTFRGPLRDAIALARLWDDAFADVMVGSTLDNPRSLRDWPQRQAWSRQCDRCADPVGPVDSSHPDWLQPNAIRDAVTAADGDGGEQFPARPTITPGSRPGRVRFSRVLNNGRERLTNPETGKRTVRMAGDVVAFKGPDPLTPILRLWFRQRWHDVPTIAQCMEWTFDGVCESPDGRTVEPDAPDSWLSLLGVV
jgi:hypothetical protein